MNKYEEALDEIGMQVNKAYIDSCYEKATKQSMRKVEDIVGVNIKILKELVDRATPKKPKDIPNSTWVECPNCGDTKINKFCPNCGQAIDWNEDDE